jgi:3-oxoacyl-[acyl-carrier-protein] synthase-3
MDKAGVSPHDLALVLPHQSNLRIIESVQEKLGLPPEKFLVNIDRYGNTSSASVGICLDEARRTGRAREGDLVLMMAMGAGLTWASALIRL